MSDPKRLGPDDFQPAAPPARPRVRDVSDASPEELAELARVQHGRAEIVARGRELAARLGAPDVAARRAEEQSRRECEWRRAARLRARERAVPIEDHDVARIALEPHPPAGQALDAVREFLAWRDGAADSQGALRCKGLFVVLSPAGGGKTSAGAWAVTWHRDSSLFLTAGEVAASPRTAFSDTHALWRRWLSPDLVVIDEIGCDREPATVLALALERYGRGRATVLTGNLTPDQFFARYPDPRLDSRMQQQAARGGPTLVELTCGDIRAGATP